jgi:hypothetical protein
LVACSLTNATVVIVWGVFARSYGISGIAYAVGCANAACAFIALAFIRTKDFASATDTFLAMARPLIAAVALMFCVLGIVHHFDSGIPGRIAEALGVTCVWFVAIQFVWPKAKAELSAHFLWKGHQSY